MSAEVGYQAAINPVEKATEELAKALVEKIHEIIANEQYPTLTDTRVEALLGEMESFDDLVQAEFDGDINGDRKPKDKYILANALLNICRQHLEIHGFVRNAYADAKTAFRRNKTKPETDYLQLATASIRNMLL